jgi:hypothetical protein
MAMTVAAVFALIALVFVVRHLGKKKSDLAQEQSKPSPTATSTVTEGGTTIVVIPPHSGGSKTIGGEGTTRPGLDAETSDLAAKIASAPAGTTIKIPPGLYPGSLILNKSVHLVGDSTSGAAVMIQAEGKSCAVVMAKGVSLANIQLVCNGIGELPALVVADGAELDLDTCKVQSNTTIGLMAAGNASVKAVGSSFTTAKGVGVRLQQNAKGNFTQSSFTNSKTGLSLTSGATGELHSCAIDNSVMNDSEGAIMQLTGDKTQLTADDCHFTNNDGGISVQDNASISLTNSSFKENGASARGIVGLIVVRTSGHVALTNDTFESNRSGVLVTDGGKLEVEKCNFNQNGFRQSQNVAAGSLPISVVGQSSSAVVRYTTIANSAPYGVSVITGGKLTIEDSEISGSQTLGLVVGDRSGPGGWAEIKQTRFIGNSTAMGVCASSSATISNSEIRENNDGLVVIDANSHVKVMKTQVLANRDHGLYAYNNGELTASDCDVQNNARGVLSGYRGKSSWHASVTLDNCRFGGNKVFGVGAGPQSELTMTHCSFDGTDKTNIYRERNAIVHNDNVAPEASPTTADDSETKSDPSDNKPSQTRRPHRNPRQPAKDPREEIHRFFRRLVPPP